MTDKEYLNTALANMHSGQWFGWRKEDDNGNKIPNDQRMSYENIIVHDSSITKPTEEEVEAKIQELKNIEVINKQNKQSALTKLSALGLTEAEIKSIIG
jgi:hypothetical protein